MQNLIECRFTGKERDSETGLYYYGARYLDGKTSRWLSADPALGDYVPGAPVDDEARKRNGNLPGMGGVFNTVNFHLYHYAGNNPVKYVDPDGKLLVLFLDKERQELNVIYTDKGGDISMENSFALKGGREITTGVVPGDFTKNERTNKLQTNNTHPKQFPDGTWNLTGTKKTTDTAKFGKIQITTDAFQYLDTIDPLTNEPTGEKTKDSGYNIHFTIYSNTDGCAGIKKQSDMQKLLNLFEKNKNSDDPRAMIVVSGNPENANQ